MSDLITLVGTIVDHEGATPLEGARVTATPSQRVTQTSDGEEALSDASATTDETGAFSLALVYAEGLRYTIVYRSGGERLMRGVLDCDSYAAGATVDVADLPPIAGVPPSAVETLQAWFLAQLEALGEGGAVVSVNGQGGVVVLDAADVGAVADDDPRLSDARTPTAHEHTAADVDSGASSDGQVLTSDGAGGAAWETPASGVTDHGLLSGLGDDDHTQYALADGSRGSFAAPLGADDNYVTDAEKAALHGHANQAALDNVSGVNTGDQDLSGYALTSSLGTAAAADTGDFATAAQGALADSATQPGDLAAVATSGEAADLDATGATDGHVLTADGAGGVAWEAAAGGGSGGTVTADDTPAAPAEGVAASYLVTSAVVWPEDLVWSTDPDGGEAPTITDTALVSLFTLGGTTYAVMGATFTAPPDTTAPTAGTLGVVVGVTSADGTVTGAADETELDAAPYSFRIDAGTWSAYQAGATYEWTGLDPATEYDFQHRVRDAAGNVTEGAVVTDTTDADTTGPTAGTLGVVPGVTTADLTVTGASDDIALHATPYAYSTDNGSTWSAYQAGATYEATGLTADTSYTFRHRVRDAAGNVTVGTAVTESTGAPSSDTTPPTPGTLAASAITDTSFTLTVSGASDAVGLHAQPYAFTTDGGTTWSAYQASAVYVASGLTASTGYSCNWRVRDAAGNVSTGTAQTVTTGAAWVPSDLGASLVAWFDASDAATITSAGGLVSQWSDKSGNGRHATQATGTAQPTTGADTQNSRNVLTFDGTSDFLGFTTPALVQPFTAFAAVKGAAVGNRVVSWSSTVQMSLEGLYAGANLAAGGVNAGQWTVSGWLADSASSWHRRNGVVLASGNAGAAATTTSAFIGTRNSTGWLSGAVGEIVIVSRALTTEEIASIEAYLGSRWGVAV